ncbi:MAG: hypothetical protein M1821_005196 [Bathelium mastoideum]|nr:MAG: hypothetical protein M1821_005196 [Bathelium mastoideum]KAI9689232.1 MAG: hypothetical protein M1822_000970 [Bathelium mastoideum]
MDSLFAQVKSLAENADEAGRKKLLDGLRGLQYAIETPQDSIQRIVFLQMRVAAARIGCDLKLFNVLADSPSPVASDELVKKTGCAPLLLGRILRYLASIGDITETKRDTYAANNVTRALAIEGFQGGVHHYFDSLGPAMQALPDFLKENDYRDITDVTKTPLQKAWNTELPAFIWVQTKPDNFKHFHQYMAVQRMGMPTWLDVYPYQKHAQDLAPDRPLFVDVGGGLGHQSVALRERLPEVKNRIIVQDQPPVLEHAIKHPGVETMPHDFLQPQSVKGAKIYYMRNIIHDWPDEKAVVILRNTIAAMAPDSVILIDDMVTPNQGARWETTQLDLTMMTCLASLERTYDQWYELAAKAGLKIVKMHMYTYSLQDHIIECVPA